MKHHITIYFLLIYLACSSCIFAQSEKIVLRAHYGIITAGYANLITTSGDGDNQHVQLTFKTTNLAEKLFRYNYNFQSHFRKTDYLPTVFACDMKEKKYNYSDSIYYNHPDKYLESNKHGKVDFNGPVYDILSVISQLRKINWSKYDPGSVVTFNIFFRNQEVFPVNIVYKGIEEVSLKTGDFSCVKLYLTSEAGKLFVSDSKLNIYITNDEKRIPVMISTDILVGSFKLDMIEYVPA